MGVRTRSFEIRTERPQRVVETCAAKAEQASAGIVFVSGPLAVRLGEIAQSLATESPNTTWLLAATAGVLTERGEIERESAVGGMVFPNLRASTLVSDELAPEFGTELAEAMSDSPSGTSLVLIRGDQNDDGWLINLDDELGSDEARIFGGGTIPDIDIYCVEAGVVRQGAAAALVFAGPEQGRVGSSSACRLLSPLSPITRSRGSMVQEIDGAPALDRLSDCAQSLDDQPLVLLAIAAGDHPLSPEGRSLALRAIQGVDPGRGGILIGDELPVGTRVAFAVRDAHGARTDLEAHLRTLRRSCAGAAPAFGLYVSCAGRGRSLYESENVDVRLIRNQFREMPLVGFHSTFELAPLAGRLTPQIYTGVLSVFSSPS